MNTIRASILGLFFTSVLHAGVLYPLQTPQQTAQFNALLKELRCLVCQNQDLADSNAGLANDLRAQVYQFVKEGKTTPEIKAYLTDRYGEFILFSPPINGHTGLLWFGPGFFLLAGFGIWRLCFSRRRIHG